MIKKIVILGTFLLVCTKLFSQQPKITNIDPVSGYATSTLNISGSGFGTTIGNIVVWFGGVRGDVISVSDNLIEVAVPAEASNNNITVVNTGSGLLDISDDKFFISHSGSAFDASQLSTPIEFTSSSSQQLFDLCSVDLDNDGLVDIATTISVGGNGIKVLKNTSMIGSVSFTEYTSADFPNFDVGFGLKNLASADLDGDGDMDVFATRNGQEKIFVFENTNTTSGTMSFSNPAQVYNMTASTVPYLPSRIMARDLTGDGKPELIVTNEAENSINILINESAGSISFNATQKIIIENSISSSSGLDVQDIDGDSRGDLIITKLFANDVLILRNIGAGSNIAFDSPISFTTGATVNVTTADYNNDGLLDLAVVGLSNSKVNIFANASSVGNISFAAPVTFATGGEPWMARSIDINGDGILDVVVSSLDETTKNYTVAINDGNLSFTSTNISVAKSSRNVSVNDYDGDGKPDFAFTSFATGDYSVDFVRNANCYTPQYLNDLPLAICAGQTKTLLVPFAPGATFNWKKDGVLQKSGTENFLDITTFGNYEIEAVSEGGACTELASTTVTNGSGSIPSNPTASNNGPTCVSGDITLSVTTVSGATYSWTGPNGFKSTDQNPTITGVTTDDAGVYTVTVKIGDCQSSEGTTVVDVKEPPVFTSTTTDPTTVCEGSTIQLVTQNTAGYSFQWMRYGSDISGATSNTYNADATGDYTVRVSENSGNCEVVTDPVSVNVFSQPKASFSISGSTCTSSDITFASTSMVDANATVIYTWVFGDGSTAGTTDLETHNYSTAGSYDVQLTVGYTSGSGCSDDAMTQTVDITDSQPLTIQSSQDYICQGESIDLSIVSTFTTADWSTGENTNTISVTNSGDYTVTAFDPNGCDVSASYTLNQGTSPTITVTGNDSSDEITITSGEEVQLAASGADSYTWDPIDFLNDATIANPISIPETTISYTVTGLSSGECPGTAQFTINVTPEGEVNIKPLKAFSPNSTIDPTWRVDNVENYPDCTMSIYDEKGTLIYQKEGYNNDWDATYKGNPLPEGVYYYVFSCEPLKPKSGSILVVR